MTKLHKLSTFLTKSSLKAIITSLILSFSLLMVGCATNPVTQKSELSLISEKQEIAMGEKNYFATQQSQGGRYNADPALDRYVKEVGKKLAKVSHRPNLPYEFVIVNDGTPNAWCLPGGKIAIHRGLLTELKNEAELAAVLSHEIVHASARHGAQGMQRGLMFAGVLAALDVALSSKPDYNRDAVVGSSAVAGQLLLTRYSRDAEMEADAYGMQTMAKAGYDPQAAVALQETFVRLSKERKSNWLSGLFASHPPSQARVVANQKTAATLPQGSLYEGRYQAAIKHLKHAVPAYKAYDEGKKLLAKSDNTEALTEADKAIRIESKEALFYALRGDAYLNLKDANAAIENYTTAISLNPNYYYFYKKRAEAYDRLDMKAQSKADLDKAKELSREV